MVPAASQRARKGEPFSVRFSLPTDHVVEDEARRTRRSKSAIVEALTEEAVRTRRFPGIGFRGEDAARRPWVIGSGLDVWEIVQMLEDFGSIERLARADAAGRASGASRRRLSRELPRGDRRGDR